ncbi:MAG: 3,4-dihydroxy-2-butanone-4-phosphate synthase [Gammaproteobacteria bacterium]|nr:3,4-dihydroxy-2-butanone-4-phosphate synthase [Gammaproteobacteria bacterium]MCF6231307.1 3,4-dihydroxy-2-butanone-4-phosphate synthase [Gammaproteobacteria bacterium]
MALNSIEEIIEDIRQGKMVVLMDDEDRENEGDLIMAASATRPEDINFMAHYGRGLICLTLTQARCEQLRLPLMVSDNNAKHSTNFTVSIEAAQGVTTGISAADRAATVLAAVAADAQPADVVQPGHIFPLKAQPGGVLTRAGHTEAGCDLAKLAGFEAAAVIVEILNQDGSMARRPDLEIFAKKHDLKMGTIADLIQYRLATEKNIERVAECQLPNEFGDFHLVAYQDRVFNQLHYALRLGELDGEKPVLVRVQVNSFLRDLLGHQEEEGLPLRAAMQRIAEEGQGVLVILQGQESDGDLVRKMRQHQMRDQGIELPYPEQVDDLRYHGIGAQILADLGVHKMRVMSAPKKTHGISGFGLEVTEYVTGS